jgi:dTDP-glucose pyrophosphorylase
MWGILPAAGQGSRIQPLAFSKELLPVGSRRVSGVERPRAVCEYALERMVVAGASRICIVVSPGKSDIVEYLGAAHDGTPIAYVVQPEPVGLCDAIFRALPLVADEEAVVVGLPDTVWFPVNALCRLGDAPLEFLLFPVEHPELFDAVSHDDAGNVLEVEVKSARPRSTWIWGAFKTNGAMLRELEELWGSRGGVDAYFGTLVNAWLARGGRAVAVRAGQAYVDVGTMNGYRMAVELLGRATERDGATPRAAGETA